MFFKASVTTKKQAKEPKSHINSPLPKATWNFGPGDSDAIYVLAGMDDPCRTLAGGFGYGVIAQQRNWLEGGAIGTALKGIR